MASSCNLRRSCSTHPGHDRRNRLILAYVATLERTPGFPDSHRTPERGPCPSRRHDRRDSRTRGGSYRSCLQHTGFVTLPPERGAARIRHHNRRDSRTRRGCTGVTSSTFEVAPHPPEGKYSTPSSATTGVILAHGAAALGLPPKRRILRRTLPKEDTARIRHHDWCIPALALDCSGVASRALNSHVASRERLVTTSYHDGWDFQRSALLFWSCLQAENAAAHPEGLAVLSTRQHGRLFHGWEPAASW